MPALIKLVGERFTPTLTGGSGGSTWYLDSPIFSQTSQQLTVVGGATSDLLVGPSLPNTWTIDAANSALLRANVRANNMRNLRGGADTDLFRSMNSSGTIAGDLDGAGGFNTLEYVTIPNPFVTDLVGGIAPRIGGVVRKIHAVIPEQLSFNAPSNLSHQLGQIVSVQLTANSAVGGTLTYGASGLPGGLSINPATGLISGTISAGTDLHGPYQVTVTLSNGANSRLRTIDWAVNALLPGDFNQDLSVDTADYVVWRKNGGSQAAFDIWLANFGRTVATGSQSLSAGFQVDDSLLVSIVQADTFEDGADGGADAMDDRGELLNAHDMAWAPPTWPTGGQRCALFHASQLRSDGRYAELDTALLARQLAFAALTDGENDRADRFAFGEMAKIGEPDVFQESLDVLFDLSISIAELSGMKLSALCK